MRDISPSSNLPSLSISTIMFSLLLPLTLMYKKRNIYSDYLDETPYSCVRNAEYLERYRVILLHRTVPVKQESFNLQYF